MRYLKSSNFKYQELPNPDGQISLCPNQYNSIAQHTQNLNNTATRIVRGGLNAMIYGNIFGDTLNEKPSSLQITKWECFLKKNDYFIAFAYMRAVIN